MTLKTDSVILGYSTTDANNFLVQTNGAGNLHIHRGTDGSGPILIRIKSDNTVEFPNQPVAAFSMVRVNTANGYGSTNTAIRRFTNITNGVNGCVIQGTDITYADSATLGASFTINTSGVYAISANDQFNAASAVGISLNTANPTTSILLIPASENLAVGYGPSAAAPACAAWTGYLPAGSVIRMHTQLSPSGTNPTCCQFTISRVG